MHPFNATHARSATWEPYFSPMKCFSLLKHHRNMFHKSSPPSGDTVMISNTSKIVIPRPNP